MQMTNNRGDYKESVSESISGFVIKVGKACTKYWQKKVNLYQAYFK